MTGWNLPIAFVLAPLYSAVLSSFPLRSFSLYGFSPYDGVEFADCFCASTTRSVNCSPAHCSLPTLKLLQESDVVFVEKAHVVDFVFEQGDSL